MPEAIRVLHVLGNLGRGGAETWAVQLFPHLDRARIRMDFLVHERGGAYETDLRDLGARIHCLENPRKVFRYERALRRLLREEGPYVAVHSHVGYFSGWVVRAAHQEGIPGRIVHSRNARDGRSNDTVRRLYRSWMRKWMHAHATHYLAVSREAGIGLFGPLDGAEGRCPLLTGVDFSSYAESPDRSLLRRRLNLPARARILGHLGSFRAQKNHGRFVEVASILAPRDEGLYFVLLGQGPLKERVEAAVQKAGLLDRFRFAGEQRDIATLLPGMDAFLFPSFHEGLPRALMEAQAAGLPCVASDTIAPSVAAFSEAVRFLSLDEPPSAWAEAVSRALADGQSLDRAARAQRVFLERGQGITSNAQYLTDLYEKIAHAPHG